MPKDNVLFVLLISNEHQITQENVGNGSLVFFVIFNERKSEGVTK